MTAFGGAIKLTGESEYRQALQKCTQNLQTMSSALKAQTIDFNNNDKSMRDSVTKQKELTDSIRRQQEELNKAKSAYAQYSVAVQTQTIRHNELNKEYKNAVLELDKIKKASGESSDEYKKQAEVVDKLGQELADSAESLNENKTAMANLKSEINSSNKVINNAQKELNDLGNEAEEAGNDAKKAGDGFTVFKGILADLGSKAIQSAISGLKKLGGALVDVGKQSINQYARYEQLVGGVETLFKDSAGIVQKYAENAYKTAGLSANDYMEQVTSFSASLLQSLGQDTKKAADYGNMAIIDMSDNANKMGTSMQMIQNAYQGFAKQNYTMLDNLKLGYGGTKTEMQRLIKDANEVKKANGEMADLTIERFGDVVEAIHIIQTQMGITGTTSKEAASTIEGSTGSMSAAWDNLLVAIADDNKDIGKSVDEFVGTVVTNAKNLVPRIKTVVNGIKKLINSIVTEVFPKLKKEIPELAPLISVFEWFIKNRNLVVNAIKAIITAFAVNKILTFTQTITDTFRSITSLTTGTTLLTKATSLLNAAWAANPIGLVIAGVTTAIGLFSIFATKTEELTLADRMHNEELKAVANTLEDYKEKMQEVDDKRQEYLDTNLSELSYYEDLVNELKSITDENGKVKDGYEQRAKFITGELKKALGIEIDYIDGQIKGYDNLETKIYDVIDAKRAQILIEAHEGEYNAAKDQKVKLEEAYTTAINENTKAEENRKNKIKEVADYLGISSEKLQEFIDNNGNLNTIKLQEYMKSVGLNISSINAMDKTWQNYIIGLHATDEQLNNSKLALDETRKTYMDNELTIKNYETALTSMKDKNYEAVLSIYEDTTNYIGKSNEETYNNYQKAINMQEDYLKQLQENKDGYDADFIKSETDKTNAIIKNLKEEQAQYKTVTEEGLKSTNAEWNKALDNTLSTITGKKVEFQKGADGNIQAYIDGVKVGEPRSQKEMETLVSTVIQQIKDKNMDANQAGQYLLDGVNSGISNQNKQNGCFRSISTFGGNLLSTLERRLGINSPSKKTKEMGKYLLEGLDVGIDKQENKTLKKVSNVGQEVISALQDELNQNVSIGDIGIPSVKNGSVDSYYNPMVSAFKEALKDMKIELDDYEVGKFVDKTVSNAVFN